VTTLCCSTNFPTHQSCPIEWTRDIYASSHHDLSVSQCRICGQPFLKEWLESID